MDSRKKTQHQEAIYVHKGWPILQDCRGFPSTVFCSTNNNVPHNTTATMTHYSTQNVQKAKIATDTTNKSV